MMTVHQIINKPIPSNCFVLFNKTIGNECVIVDPGSRSDKVLFDFFENQDLLPKYIILTHEHFDHCWGVNELVERFRIPIVCSTMCAERIKSYKKNCSVFYDNEIRFTIDSRTVSIESLGFELPFGGTMIRFYNTPGHSDASICFSVEHCFFSGDTLLKDKKTVTKLPTGSFSKLKETIQSFVDMQGRGYMVYPGHGDLFLLDGYDLELMVK